VMGGDGGGVEAYKRYKEVPHLAWNIEHWTFSSRNHPTSQLLVFLR